MLRFQQPPDTRNLTILQVALEDALAWWNSRISDHWSFSEWYPESAKCFDPHTAKEQLENLLHASKDSAVWQPTDYHWLLLYEVLFHFCQVFNDDPEAVSCGELVNKYGIEEIDFDEILDLYFWDLDFLTPPSTLLHMTQQDRQAMGFTQEAFGVIQRWKPHPRELALVKWKESDE
jgi:hypothetical protein